MNRKVLMYILFSFLSLFGIYYIMRMSEIKETFYADINAARKAGAIEPGWIPKVIPESATDIYERHDIDTNTVWLRFKFDKRDINELVAQIEEVKPAEIEGIEFPSMGVKWWPKSLNKNSFTQHGLIIYKYVRKVEYSDKRVKTVPSFFVIDWNLNMAYYWQ